MKSKERPCALTKEGPIHEVKKGHEGPKSPKKKKKKRLRPRVGSTSTRKRIP